MSTMDMKQSSHPAHNMPGSQYAGEVVNFPIGQAQSDYNRLRGEGGFKDSPVKKFDPQGDMTGGGKVVKLPGVE
jgi:hypothetical protein